MKNVTRRRSLRGGFTLIELLIVIAIIALLIGMLLPALRGSRRAAHQTMCLANIRSVQTAQLMYADDFKGHLADVGLPHGGGGDPALSFIFSLREYIGAYPQGYNPAAPAAEYVVPAVLRSPGDRSRFWLSRDGGQGPTGGLFRRTSYGMNNYLSRTFNPGISANEPFDRIEKIATPARTIQFFLMAEEGAFAVSDHAHVEGWSDERIAPRQAATQVHTSKWGGRSASAFGQSHYSFLDGHVAGLRFDAVYVNERVNQFNPERN